MITRARRLAPVALFALAIGLQPTVAEGAGNHIGQYAEASFDCHPFTGQILVQAAAGSAPGYATQWIFYRHYFWQDGRGWLAVDPAAEGFILHDARALSPWANPGAPGTWWQSPLPTALGEPWTVTLPGGGNIAVYTEYWWWAGASWVGPVGAWSNWVTYRGAPAAVNTPWCNLNL